MKKDEETRAEYNGLEDVEVRARGAELQAEAGERVPRENKLAA